MCPLSTVACSAVPSSLFLVSAASKINQGSGLGFLLCIWFWLLYSSFFLGCFSFFLYSPLPSLSLQMNQYWREHLMCLFPRLEPAPLAAEPLLWLWQVPCSPCCAPVWCILPCLSLWGAAHSQAPTLLLLCLPELQPEGGKWYSWCGNGLLSLPCLCPGRRVCEEMASEIL